MWRIDEASANQCRQSNHKKGRENPRDATLIEYEEAEVAGVAVLENDCGNEIARDDEEDIDTDEPAGQPAVVEMKGKH